MNCKLKLHSKGFYYQIVGAVMLLKFLQTQGHPMDLFLKISALQAIFRWLGVWKK